MKSLQILFSVSLLLFLSGCLEPVPVPHANICTRLSEPIGEDKNYWFCKDLASDDERGAPEEYIKIGMRSIDWEMVSFYVRSLKKKIRECKSASTEGLPPPVQIYLCTKLQTAPNEPGGFYWYCVNNITGEEGLVADKDIKIGFGVPDWQAIDFYVKDLKDVLLKCESSN